MACNVLTSAMKLLKNPICKKSQWSKIAAVDGRFDLAAEIALT
jgi:hypothetical protein